MPACSRGAFFHPFYVRAVRVSRLAMSDCEKPNDMIRYDVHTAYLLTPMTRITIREPIIATDE